jgi:hypothetical protein
MEKTPYNVLNRTNCSNRLVFLTLAKSTHKGFCKILKSKSLPMRREVIQVMHQDSIGPSLN